ncbi:MAG: hypothetical protein VKS61_06085 [Candidatus Sericytochromatia bacterium]|nr:hypothetical protein [Candidatus Sericytochromatia bacterium]
MTSPDDRAEGAQPRKPYDKPRLESHRVFEVSLSCVKIPGAPSCAWNVTRVRS